MEDIDLTGNAHVVGKSLADLTQSVNTKRLAMVVCEMTKQELEEFVQNLKADKMVINLVKIHKFIHFLATFFYLKFHRIY